MQYDPEKPSWSIMTKSRGGTVSVIKDLTLEQARRTYERLDEWYGMADTCMSVHPDFLQDGCSGMVSGGACRTCQDSDIEVREVFGPPGWDGFGPGEIERWPKITTVYTDDKFNILPDEYQTDPEAAQHERAMEEARKRFVEPRDAEAPTPPAPRLVREGAPERPWLSRFFRPDS